MCYKGNNINSKGIWMSEENQQLLGAYVKLSADEKNLVIGTINALLPPPPPPLKVQSE